MGGACGHMAEKRCAYWVLEGDLRERNHLEHVSIDGRIILKYTF